MKRYYIDILFLAAMLTVAACVFRCGNQSPEIPCVDMSEATLVWQGEVK
jgi:hypothetical protein